MTGNHTYALQSRVGRKKEFEERITLPLSSEMLSGVDAVRVEGEDRLSVIRQAIEREIKRRQKTATPKS